jgi:protein-tyrosine-phosphatase|tara:strand:- start:33 stop:416 length:384 start_codon:yes stop_codon:yes gene_type:complete
MAEGLAQKWLDDNGFTDWLAVSAGVYAIEGSPTSQETIKSLSDRGIEFEGTSYPLTQDMATSAKIVLCMSGNHLKAAHKFTEHAELLDPSGDIPDPIGQDQSAYDTLAQKMEKLIATKLQSLTNEGE